VRSAILMEMFDPPEATGPLEQKLEVVAAHSATALYNAAEMKRVPFKPLWWPVMRVQQGLGGKARFWVYFTLGMLLLLTLSLTLIQYPLKLDAKGKLAPLDRYYVFPKADGQVVEIKVIPGQEVLPGAPVAVVHKTEWAKEIIDLKSRLNGANDRIRQFSQPREGENRLERSEREQNRSLAEIDRRKIAEELSNYEHFYSCDLSRPGHFFVTAPSHRPSAATGRPLWTVVTQDLRDMKSKPANPKEPLMRVGNVSGGWEIVLKVPQKHMGKVRKAFVESPEDDNDGRGPYLWVDVLVSSEPTPGHQGRGRMYLSDVTAMAEPNRDDQNESEPVVVAYVRINTPYIPAQYHLDPNLLVTDVEVSARIRAGDHSMGYSLFYGVWEFLYEKVIFFF